MVNMILGTSWRDGDKLTNPGGWGPGKEGRPGIQIARHTFQKTETSLRRTLFNVPNEIFNVKSPP